MKKFLFDSNNFDQVKEVAPSFTPEEMEHAKTQSYNQGRASGVKEAQKWQEEIMSVTLQEIGMLTEKLALAEEKRELDNTVAAVRLAMRVTHKLLPQFAQKFAMNEIERIILDALEIRRDEPRIAVTVSSVHLEALKARVDAYALEKGFAGKMIIIGDDHMKDTDCRVEWADGGAERLYERLFAQIENEFAKAIAGIDSLRDTKQTENH